MSFRDRHWDPDHDLDGKLPAIPANEETETCGGLPDLDGTPLPAGHGEYTELQNRFDELWQKCRDETATADEKAEMLRMQEEYWTKRNAENQP